MDNSKLTSKDTEKGSEVSLIIDVPVHTLATTSATIARIVLPTERTNIKESRAYIRVLVVMQHE